MHRWPLFFLAIALFILTVDSQTITTTNADGISVVEVVTEDVNGLAATQTLQTLSTSSATTTTTEAAHQGPVGQPAPTSGTPGGPTPYTYTTVVNGVTTAVADTFTPTTPATTRVDVGSSGSILDYSSWLSIYGNPAQSGAAANNGCTVAVVQPFYLLLSIVAAVFGGCLLVFI